MGGEPMNSNSSLYYIIFLIQLQGDSIPNGLRVELNALLNIEDPTNGRFELDYKVSSFKAHERFVVYLNGTKKRKLILT